MKKLLAVMLAMVMVLSLLAGCGSKSSKKNNNKDDEDDDDKETTSDVASDASGEEGGKKEDDKKDDDKNNGDAATGTVLDDPEKVFDLDACNQLHVKLTAETPDGAMTISIKKVKDGDTTAYCFTVDEGTCVFEVNGSDFAYYESTDGTSFVSDTTATAEELQELLEGNLQYITLYNSFYEDEELKFRKSDANITCPTGAVYVYDIMHNDNVTSQICVDKATGYVVKFATNDGSSTMDVAILETSGVQLPAYK